MTAVAVTAPGGEFASSVPTITPSGDGRLIVALFGADPGSNPRTGTPDTSPAASERLDTQNGTQRVWKVEAPVTVVEG